MAIGTNSYFQRRYWPVCLTLVLGFLVSGGLGWTLHRQAVKLDEQRFDLETKVIAAMLEQEMERYEERLARLADHCAQFDELPERIWQFRSETVTDVSVNLPSMDHVVYCPKIVATNFQAHLVRGQAVWGDKRYRFDPQPNLRRGIALPIWQSWSRNAFPPLQPGMDMMETADWHPSLERALNKTTWISPEPAHVIRRDGKTEAGFWFVHTLYNSNQTATTWRKPGESEVARVQRHREFRQSAAKGVLAAFISTDRMVDRAFNHPDPPRRVHVRLYANREPAAAALMNSSSSPPKSPRHYKVIPQPWYGRQWSLEFASTPLFEAESLRYRALLAAAAGTMMTLLAAALVGVSLRARIRQERMTVEVIEARDALAAAEKEREKLGHDLHDGAIQALYAIQLGLNHTSQKLEAQPANARRELSAVRAELDEVIAEIRRFIIAEEGPEMAADLSGVLRALVERARAGTRAQIEARCDPEASDRLAGDQAVQLANIAREALSNSLRHSRSRQVQIALRSEPDAVCLEVFDNGTGFDPESQTRGVGLTSMTTRAREIGAALDIQSAPGQGTRVVIRVPVSPPERAEAPCADAEPDES